MKLTKIFTALAVTLLAANANAGVVSVGTVQTPADVACAGCIANDIEINFAGNVRGQQLWLNLTSGSVYNTDAAGFGGDTAPNGALFAVNPAVEFDSFISVGGTTSASSLAVLIAGNAVDIPGAPREGALGVGNDDNGVTSISVAWAPATTAVDVPSGAAYPVGRITLTGDANGDAWIFSSTGADGNGNPTGEPLLTRRSVINGVIVPEPASMALAGFAVLGLIASRRRS